MKNTKKLALAALFCALAVVGSLFSFPVFGSKCAPVQHLVNILCAVLLGPWYGVGVAFVASLLRNLLGLGSLMAFPGSMIGALLCGIVYWKTKNLLATLVGEVFGTAVLGGLCAYPVAIFLMGKSAADIAFYAYIVPFLISTAGGAVIAAVILVSLKKAGALSFRTETALQLLREVRVTVIRGNPSELHSLALGIENTGGVDAEACDRVTEANLTEAVRFAKDFARKTGAVVAMTGAIDIVTDGEAAYCIHNGHPLMSAVTGAGCQLSALTAAFLGANPSAPLPAAASAVCALGLAGETAYPRLSPLDGNASYRNFIIDATFRLTPEALEQGAKYELR